MKPRHYSTALIRLLPRSFTPRRPPQRQTRRHTTTGVFGTLLLAVAIGSTGCGKSDAGKAPSGRETTSTAIINTATAPAASQPGIFEDVTMQAGFNFVHQLADRKLSNIMESDGAGGAMLDFDGDGFIDVYLVNSGPDKILSDAPAGTPREPNRLLRNKADSTFEDVTEKAGVAGHGFGTTAAAADYDNDGDADLLVVDFGACILFQNQGDGTFKDVTVQAGLKTTNACISATFLDADGDGFLDLFIANYLVFDPSIKPPAGSPAPYPGPLAYAGEFNILYRNRGDGTFEDISEAAGIRIAGHRAMSVAPLDYDLDGDQDLYVSNDGTPNLLLVNDGKGHFHDVGLQSGVAFNQFGEPGGSMGAAVGDCNGDGLPDMLVTRFGLASLYINSRRGLFEDRASAAGILNASREYTGWGGNFLDFDNDGDLDLLIANGNAHFMTGMPPLLLENTGNAIYLNAAAKGGPLFRRLLNARGCGVFDFDNDGRPDIVLTTLGDHAVLLHNRGETRNHWLTLKLEGARGNRDGFGALLNVTAGGRTWYAEARCPTSYVFQQDARLHFGLGNQSKAERIEIKWPGGQVQTLIDVAADRLVNIREPGESRWTGAKK